MASIDTSLLEPARARGAVKMAELEMYESSGDDTMSANLLSPRDSRNDNSMPADLLSPRDSSNDVKLSKFGGSNEENKINESLLEPSEMPASDDIQPDSTIEIRMLSGSVVKAVQMKIGNKAPLFLRDRSIELKSAIESGVAADVVAAKLFKYSGDADGVVPFLQEYASQDIRKLLTCTLVLADLTEPLAWAVREVFFKLVNIYEEIIKQNSNIEEVVWMSLIDKWESNDPDLTSSKLLWNLTRDEGFREVLLSSRPEWQDWYMDMKAKQFSYRGFCPKVPFERLQMLLKFPIVELVNRIGEVELLEKIKQLNGEFAKILAGSESVDEAKIAPGVKRKPLTDEEPFKIMEQILHIESQLRPQLEYMEQFYNKKIGLFGRLLGALNELFPLPSASNAPTASTEVSDDEEDD